jgi:hypothetical protein
MGCRAEVARQSRHGSSSSYAEDDNEVGRVLVGNLQDFVCRLTLRYNHFGESGMVGSALDEFGEPLPRRTLCFLLFARNPYMENDQPRSAAFGQRPRI